MLLAGLFLVLGAGCRSSEPVESKNASLSTSRIEVARAVTSHLRALDSDGLRYRETATLGEARVSSYIAGHFSRFDLQPPVAGGHEQTYPLRKHLLGESQLWLLEADTTQFVYGRDFTVHPRSSTGRVDVRILPGRTILSAARGALRLDTTVAAPAIFRPEKEGIRLVLDRRVWPAFVQPRVLTTTVRAMVSAQEDIVTGHLVGGLYAGAMPRMRDSLLVVLLRMDALESGVKEANVAMAAFLETAHRVQILRLERTPVPQSIYFAAYSGTEESCQGPQWLMRNLPWSREAIAGVVHVGAKPDCWDRMDPVTVVESGSDGTAEERARVLLEHTLSWIHSHAP